MTTILIKSLIYPISSDYSIYSELLGIDPALIQDLLAYLAKELPHFDRYAQKRKSEKLCSLLALRSLLISQGEDFRDGHWEDLLIKDYKSLPIFPRWHLSITHDKNYCVVALSQKDEIKALGLDLEALDRPIGPSTWKFWCNEEDDSLDNFPEAIYAWCLKEAAYKALWPLSSSLKEIVIKKDGSFYLRSDPKIFGFSEFVLHRRKGDKTHLLCCAIIPLKKNI